MKILYFIRHAKSSWAQPDLRDFDRPLNKRGLRDAPFMAEKMKSFGMQPNAILTSPANRARTTAGYFAETYGITGNAWIEDKDLYHAYSDTILEVVRAQSNEWQTLLVFGHNPGFTSLANQFRGGKNIDNVPTCGIFKIESEAAQWVDLKTKNSRLTEFHYPKQYFS